MVPSGGGGPPCRLRSALSARRTSSMWPFVSLMDEFVGLAIFCSPAPGCLRGRKEPETQALADQRFRLAARSLPWRGPITAELQLCGGSPQWAESDQSRGPPPDVIAAASEMLVGSPARHALTKRGGMNASRMSEATYRSVTFSRAAISMMVAAA